jgi:PAS domain-containing protein
LEPLREARRGVRVKREDPGWLVSGRPAMLRLTLEGTERPRGDLTLVDRLPAVIYLSNIADGRMVDVSPGLEQLLGVAPETCTSKAGIPSIAPAFMNVSGAWSAPSKFRRRQVSRG